MKKKILIFHPYLAPYRVDLYNVLSKDFELEVLLTGGDREISALGFDLGSVNNQAEFDFKYYKNGIRIGRHLLSFIYQKKIFKFRPDIVICHELGINTLFAIFYNIFLRYSVFVTCDDSPSISKSYRLPREMLRRFVLSMIDGLIVVNPIVKNYLLTKYPKFNCRYIYFPIIQNDIVLKNKLDLAIPISKLNQEKYGLVSCITILFVGRLELVKNPIMLLEAFSKLHTINRDVRLIFVGEGSQKRLLMDRVKQLSLANKVFFTGMISGSELYSWYNIANIFVLPSIFEPFGAVVNEALVAGCNVVVSNEVGAASLVSSENGIVFKSGDEVELFEGLVASLKKIDDRDLRESKMDKPFYHYYHELIMFLTDERKK